MSVTHQMYCTHCTYGTAFLEKKEGELKDRTFGYSVRASSQGIAETREVYQSVQRLMFYHLPSSTPTDDRKSLSPSDAPGRMLVFPSYHQRQIVALVSYRIKDTSGRVGSYFAHVLHTSEKNPSWTLRHCLHLWQSPRWVRSEPGRCDSLDELKDIQQFHPSRKAVLNEKLLTDFFTEAKSEKIHPRWRQMDASERIGIFSELLQKLKSRDSENDRVLLIVEPEMAALLYYALARLLPEQGPLSKLSFSTYEPSLERPSATVNATVFHDSTKEYPKREELQQYKAIINTFHREIESKQEKSTFAQFIFQRLIDAGWAEVDQILDAFDAEHPCSWETLDRLPSVTRLTELLISGDASTDLSKLDSDQELRSLVIQQLAHRLTSNPDSAERLQAILDGENWTVLCELIGGSQGEKPDRLMSMIVEQIQTSRLSQFLAARQIKQEIRSRLLRRFVEKKKQLPQEWCQQAEEPPLRI